jgi:hypothetical protein
MFKLIYQHTEETHVLHSSKQTCRVWHITPELRFINDSASLRLEFHQ